MAGNVERNMSGDNIETSSEFMVDAQFPLVLQCSECNLIIGDSKSWVNANDDLKSITLKGVTDNVQIDTKINVSSAGIDAGSTYRVLKCTGCENKLGVQYLATPPEYDQFRNCFTLDVKKITSYQVGSEGQSSGSELVKCVSIEDMYQQIRKVQLLMVEFGQRILVLEEKLNVGYQEGQDTDSEQPQHALNNNSSVNNSNHSNNNHGNHSSHGSQGSHSKRKLSTSGSSVPSKKPKSK